MSPRLIFTVISEKPILRTGLIIIHAFESVIFIILKHFKAST